MSGVLTTVPKVTAPGLAETWVVENRPKASMVAKTPTANSRANPKDVPILVFIYYYLLFRDT